MNFSLVRRENCAHLSRVLFCSVQLYVKLLFQELYLNCVNVPGHPWTAIPWKDHDGRRAYRPWKDHDGRRAHPNAACKARAKKEKHDRNCGHPLIATQQIRLWSQLRWISQRYSANQIVVATAITLSTLRRKSGRDLVRKRIASSPNDSVITCKRANMCRQ